MMRKLLFMAFTLFGFSMVGYAQDATSQNRLPVYKPDVAHHLNLKYENNMAIKGVDTQKYTLPSDPNRGLER